MVDYLTYEWGTKPNLNYIPTVNPKITLSE